MLYHAPPGSTDANAPYVGKNVTAGIQGSKVPPAAVEFPQREIVAAVAAAGLAATDSDLTQLAQSIATGLFLGTFGGTANALTANLPTGAAFPILLGGLLVAGVIPATNTGAVTFDLEGFGASPGPKAIKRRDGTTALAPGDLVAGSLVAFRYVGGVWRHVGMALSEVVGTTLNSTQLTSVSNYLESGVKETDFGPSNTGAMANGVITTLVFPDASTADFTNGGASGFTVKTAGLYAIEATATIGANMTSASPSINGYIVAIVVNGTTVEVGQQLLTTQATGIVYVVSPAIKFKFLNVGDVVTAVARINVSLTSAFGSASYSNGSLNLTKIF